ncbi:serine hydrolase FSH [Dipodascopsis uninucleata]
MGKILFLHGFTQSGDLLSRKTSGLNKVLESIGIQCYYPTAPIKCLLADVQDGNSSKGIFDFNDNSYCWWNLSLDEKEYPKIDVSWQFLAEYIRKEGPFDGVAGFSQGGAMAGMLVNKIQSLVPEHPPFKLLMVYSGYTSKIKIYQHLYEPLISIPSLHVLGSLDTVVEQHESLKLVKKCVPGTATTYYHPGGHFIPASKEFCNITVAFVQKAMAEYEDEAVEDDDDQGWESDFDNIGGGM